MPFTVSLLQILGGVAYLLMGGDLLVRGAMALARTARVSPMVVGLTVVALGTSAPELVVTLHAALAGYPELAFANVVGSNIANVLLALGLPALLYPLACDQRSARDDATIMVLVTTLFMVLCFDGTLSRLDGGLLLAGMVIFLAWQARTEYESEPTGPPRDELPMVLGLPQRKSTIASLIIVGIVMLPVGANLLVDGAVGLADRIGVSNEVIGLTVVAISTSVPELATTLVAAMQRQSDVAIGNVIGSNILNLLGIMGAASLASLHELTVAPRFLAIDMPVMMAASLLLLAVAVARGRIGKRLGSVMLFAYFAYIAIQYAAMN